ncbi:MAG: translesion error-prone DNA polymerase V autoproteolytic subunit [Fibrobacteres bacterium]|nr:translesion error-prone DNA polymerase V autoproteolytic subunit [Fibrobacterota bacterium]
MAKPRIIKKTGCFEFYSADFSTALEIPLVSGKVSAGFPSPADDYLEMKLDIVKHMIKHPAATFFVRVTGTSMKEAGIQDGDLLVVDRSLQPKSGSIAVCLINGEFTVKRLLKTGKKLMLQPENADFKPIEIKDGSEFEVWGIVSYVIHKA